MIKLLSDIADSALYQKITNEVCFNCGCLLEYVGGEMGAVWVLIRGDGGVVAHQVFLPINKILRYSKNLRFCGCQNKSDQNGVTSIHLPTPLLSFFFLGGVHR